MGPVRADRAARTALAAVAALLVALVPSAAARAAQPVPGPGSGAPAARTIDDAVRAWRATAPSTVLVGRSVLGRPILAHRQGPADAPSVLLVLGQMHGSEPRGRDVVRAITSMAPPPGVQVWTISTMNPDGAAVGRRTNAHGVDPNRNFPYGWSPRYSSRLYYYPGSAPATEPEVVALMAFLDQLRPDLIVSMHQHYHAVDLGGVAKTWPWAHRLSTAMHLRATVVPCNIGTCTGTMTAWFNATHPGVAITVELPLSVPPSLATAYARAILGVGALLGQPGA